jgi:hypothetical protein
MVITEGRDQIERTGRRDEMREGMGGGVGKKGRRVKKENKEAGIKKNDRQDGRR